MNEKAKKSEKERKRAKKGTELYIRGMRYVVTPNQITQRKMGKIIHSPQTFRHKGLKLLFEEDDGKKLPSDILLRIRIILSTLHAAQDIEGMNLPTFRLHPSKGI